MTRPGKPVINNTSDGSLICPGCRSSYSTHIELVQVAARGEDRDFNEISVNAVTGRVETHGSTPAPTGPFGEGRRHRITLSGFCEECGHEFALVFLQHKGDTIIEWAAPTVSVDPRRSES